MDTVIAFFLLTFALLSTQHVVHCVLQLRNVVIYTRAFPR